MDALEPEWKYLSGLAVKKGATKAAAMGALDNLLALRRRPARTTTMPPPPDMPDKLHMHQQQGEPVLDLDHDPISDTAPQLPTVPVQPAGQQGRQPHAEQPVPVARQTRSGRVDHNTPRYEQSVTQRDQGLIAWEVLLDQDEQERVPTAASQYKLQKSLENPLVFAASDNPDILYWDQVMKAPDTGKIRQGRRSRIGRP